MKLVLFSLFAVITLSSNSFAGPTPTEQSSWDEIFKSKNVIAKIPSVQLHSHYGAVDYTVFSVCQKDGDLFLNSGETITVCLDNTSYEYRNKGGSVCRFKKEVTLSTPMIFTQSICTKYSKGKNDQNRCLATEDRITTIPTDYNIRVYEYFPSFVGKSPARIGKQLFVKEYEIPQCSEVTSN